MVSTFSTHLKNISQIGSFPQVGVKKNWWNHHLVNYMLYISTYVDYISECFTRQWCPYIWHNLRMTVTILRLTRKKITLKGHEKVPNMILFWVYHRYWVQPPPVFQSPPGLLHSRESQAKPLLATGILGGRSNMQISMLPSLSSPSSQLSHEKKKTGSLTFHFFILVVCS